MCPNPWSAKKWTPGYVAYSFYKFGGAPVRYQGLMQMAAKGAANEPQMSFDSCQAWKAWWPSPSKWAEVDVVLVHHDI